MGQLDHSDMADGAVKLEQPLWRIAYFLIKIRISLVM
jgi:hypothetical protein